MSVKIKKQVLNDKGFVIEEYEGTEEEVEAYERKRNKKAQAEVVKKEKTILYGKDLEDIRKVVREEVAKVPAPVVLNPTYPLFPYVLQLTPTVLPTWTVRCPWCGSYNCQQSHIICSTNTSSTAEVVPGGPVAWNDEVKNWNGMTECAGGVQGVWSSGPLPATTAAVQSGNSVFVFQN